MSQQRRQGGIWRMHILQQWCISSKLFHSRQTYTAATGRGNLISSEQIPQSRGVHCIFPVIFKYIRTSGAPEGTILPGTCPSEGKGHCHWHQTRLHRWGKAGLAAGGSKRENCNCRVRNWIVLRQNPPENQPRSRFCHSSKGCRSHCCKRIAPGSPFHIWSARGKQGGTHGNGTHNKLTSTELSKVPSIADN